MNNSNKTTREENNNVDLLQREIFRMQTQLTRKDIEVDELKEENKLLRESNERMKEALKPFAKMWGELTEEKVRQGGIVYEYNNSRITVADLFTAFNVLNPTK